MQLVDGDLSERQELTDVPVDEDPLGLFSSFCRAVGRHASVASCRDHAQIPRVHVSCVGVGKLPLVVDV